LRFAKSGAGLTFFALHGAKADGNTFIRTPSSGVRLHSERRAGPEHDSGRCAVDSGARSAEALAITAANFLGHPRTRCNSCGDRTNGKTTTTSVVDAIVKAPGRRPDVRNDCVSHTARRLSCSEYDAGIGGPAGFFTEIRDAGGKYAVLEASSHSLAMDRLWGCHFQAAVFTNLTREHMDFHQTFEIILRRKDALRGHGAGAPKLPC